MPQGDAKLPKIAVGQIGEDLVVDFALAKRGLVLAKSETSQPIPHVHVSHPIVPANMIVELKLRVYGVIPDRDGRRRNASCTKPGSPLGSAIAAKAQSINPAETAAPWGAIAQRIAPTASRELTDTLRYAGLRAG